MAPNKIAAPETEHRLIFDAARHTLLRHFVYDIFWPHVTRSRAVPERAHESDYGEKLRTEFESYKTKVLAFLKPQSDSDLGAVDTYCSVLRDCINRVELAMELVDPPVGPDPDRGLIWYGLREEVLGRKEEREFRETAGKKEGIRPSPFSLWPARWPVDFIRDRLRDDILDAIKNLTYLWFMLVQHGMPHDFRRYLKNIVLPAVFDRNTSRLSDNWTPSNWVITEVDELSTEIDGAVECRLKHGSAMHEVREAIRGRAEQWKRGQEAGKRAMDAEPSAAVLRASAAPVGTLHRLPSADELRRAGLPKDIAPYEIRSENGRDYITAYSNSTATVNSYALKVFEDQIELARKYCQDATEDMTVERVVRAFPGQPLLERVPGSNPQEKSKWIQVNIINKKDDLERSNIREAATELYRNTVDTIPELAKYKPSQIDTRSPSEVRADLADTFYLNLKALSQATRLRRKAEETLRLEHPEMIDFWRAVDSVEKSIREEFFAFRVWGKSKEQLFDFMAEMPEHLFGGASSVTLYADWKKHRLAKRAVDIPKNP